MCSTGKAGGPTPSVSTQQRLLPLEPRHWDPPGRGTRASVHGGPPFHSGKALSRLPDTRRPRWSLRAKRTKAGGSWLPTANRVHLWEHPTAGRASGGRGRAGVLCDRACTVHVCECRRVRVCACMHGHYPCALCVCTCLWVHVCVLFTCARSVCCLHTRACVYTVLTLCIACVVCLSVRPDLPGGGAVISGRYGAPRCLLPSHLHPSPLCTGPGSAPTWPRLPLRAAPTACPCPPPAPGPPGPSYGGETAQGGGESPARSDQRRGKGTRQRPSRWCSPGELDGQVTDGQVGSWLGTTLRQSGQTAIRPGETVRAGLKCAVRSFPGTPSRGPSDGRLTQQTCALSQFRTPWITGSLRLVPSEAARGNLSRLPGLCRHPGVPGPTPAVRVRAHLPGSHASPRGSLLVRTPVTLFRERARFPDPRCDRGTIPWERSSREGWGHQEAATWVVIGARASRRRAFGWGHSWEAPGRGVALGAPGWRGPDTEDQKWRRFGQGRRARGSRRHLPTARDTCLLPTAPPPRPVLPGPGLQALVLLGLGTSQRSRRSVQ